MEKIIRKGRRRRGSRGRGGGRTGGEGGREGGVGIKEGFTRRGGGSLIERRRMGLQGGRKRVSLLKGAADRWELFIGLDLQVNRSLLCATCLLALTLLVDTPVHTIKAPYIPVTYCYLTLLRITDRSTCMCNHAYLFTCYPALPTYLSCNIHKHTCTYN